MNDRPIIGILVVMVIVAAIFASGYLIYSIVWYIIHNGGFAPFLP